MSVCLFFFFKQKTAYEMRISDWSSDVCSSDLHEATDDDDDDDDRRRSPPTSPEPEYPEPEVSKPPAGDPASTPTTDARQPPRVARPPADDIRRTSPVHRLGPCCVGGVHGTTKQLTPGQCQEEGGEPGTCTIIKIG